MKLLYKEIVGWTNDIGRESDVPWFGPDPEKYYNHLRKNTLCFLGKVGLSKEVRAISQYSFWLQDAVEKLRILVKVDDINHTPEEFEKIACMLEERIVTLLNVICLTLDSAYEQFPDDHNQIVKIERLFKKLQDAERIPR